jgi:hypothetical protein
MTPLLWVWIISLIITILFISIPVLFVSDKTGVEAARIYGIMDVLSGLSTVTFIGSFIAWLIVNKQD